MNVVGYITMSGRLEDRTVLVTGAATGIGRAIAGLYAEEGARLLLHYHRSETEAGELAGQIRAAGGEAMTLQADLGQEAEAERLVAEAWKRAGRIHVWVNNAGADILTGAGAEAGMAERLERLVRVDLLGTIRCCWQVAPRMRSAGGGVILNMSWDLAPHGMAGRTAQIFAAVKAGISGFSKSLALSWAPQVRVNELAPGWIETRYARTTMPAETRRDVVERTPLGRLGLPLDVAYAALYLASDEAAFITGQTLRINGGWIG